MIAKLKTADIIGKLPFVDSALAFFQADVRSRSRFCGFPMSADPPYVSSKKVLAIVTQLQRAIQRGSLDKREMLAEKMGELAMALTTEGRFDSALKTWDELLELTEILKAEGKLGIALKAVVVVLPMINAGLESAQRHGGKPGFNEEAYFQRLRKGIAMLSEEEFHRIKNECALLFHNRAKSLQANGAHIAAIALLDESLRTMEPLFDPETTRFVDWKSLLDIYGSRGQWKCEIGDQESGIADLLHYEKLAEQAADLLQRNMVASRKKMGTPSIQDGKIVIRISTEEYIDFTASFKFQEDRYDAILQLANAYNARAEKEKALEYFDKALAIAQEDKDAHSDTRLAYSRLDYFAASMDIPYRKGVLLAQYGQYKKALEQFDLAITNVRELLQSQRQEFFEALEDRFIEISQARTGVLQNLGRFDEAVNAADLTKQLFTQTLKPEEVGDDNPLSMKNLLARKSGKEQLPLRKVVPDGEELDEMKVLRQFGILHNEAMMDFQRAQIEMNRRHWRKALRLMLKARFVIDSPAMITFPEAKKNVFGLYASLAGVYLMLKDYEKAQLWYERTVRHSQSLIDEGDSDLRSEQCIVRQGLGEVYSRQGRHEKSLVEFSLAFAGRARLIEEQEVALEGLDRERLRIHDNQKLMPLAALYQAQVDAIRFIENQIFATNSPQAAESWARIEMETFEKFRALLLQREQADGVYAETVASCAALLRWGGEEAKGNELLERWVVENQKQFESENAARSYIHVGMAIRWQDLYALTDFRDGGQLYSRLANLKKMKRFQEAYQTARVLRALLVHEQSQLQDPPPFKRDFYESLLVLVDREARTFRNAFPVDETESAFQNHPYDPDEMREIFDRMEEEENAENAEDEPDEDENAALYERDFETASDNHAMLFKMLDAFSGKNQAEQLTEEYDRRKGSAHNIGRNDPCPCGSGKKYKKCCMEK